MKAVVFIIWISILSLNVETTTLQNQIEIDGEIHKQNIISSVEDFLNEMGLDADTCYIPFRDENNHEFPIHPIN